MHRCVFKDRIEERKGRLCRIVRADWIDSKGSVRTKQDGTPYSVDVYLEDEEGFCFARYLYLSQTGGYLVAFPGENDKTLGIVEPYSKFCKAGRIQAFSSLFNATDTDVKNVLNKYPDFRYVTDKWHGSVGQMFTALQRWKKFPRVELLLAAGYENIAFGKKFYTLSEKKQREILLFLKKQNDKEVFRNASADDILVCLKYGFTCDEFEGYKMLRRRAEGRISGDIVLYFRRNHIPLEAASVRLYYDYKNMAIRAGHSFADCYWRYPKNLRKMHDKVMAELENMELEKSRNRQEKFYLATSRLSAKKGMFDGFQIYVPRKISDVKFQARILNQCLITADYVGRVIDGVCTLVFIRKNNRPVATVEIKSNRKIGQFYCDEHDRKNCLPSENMRIAFSKWLRIATG